MDRMAPPLDNLSRGQRSSCAGSRQHVPLGGVVEGKQPHVVAGCLRFSLYGWTGVQQPLQDFIDFVELL